MNDIWSHLNALDGWSKVIVSLITALVAAYSFVGRLRRTVNAWLKARYEDRNWRSNLVASVTRAEESIMRRLETIEATVGVIKKEVEVNGGGSIKDAVTYLERNRLHEFKQKPQPAFECNGSGFVLFCSDGFRAMLATDDENDVVGQNWRQFIDQRWVANFNESCRQGFSNNASIRAKALLVDKEGAFIGVWEMRATALGSQEKQRYAATWIPSDDAARAIAGRRKLAHH